MEKVERQVAADLGDIQNKDAIRAAGLALLMKKQVPPQPAPPARVLEHITPGVSPTTEKREYSLVEKHEIGLLTELAAKYGFKLVRNDGKVVEGVHSQSKSKTTAELLEEVLDNKTEDAALTEAEIQEAAKVREQFANNPDAIKLTEELIRKFF